MMNMAIYPGSFDPLTLGHLDILERASRVFDRVLVAIGRNSRKAPWFTVEERLAMIREACKPYPNIEADAFDGLIVSYAKAKGAGVLIRGLRTLSDFEYEFQMSLVNRNLEPSITTLFMMPSEKYVHLNSTIVREVARYEGPLEDYVPAVLVPSIREKAKLAKGIA